MDRMAGDLVDEYRKQRAWRPWPAVFRLLPDISGQIVLDLGCGIGDQAAELSDRDATVIAVDGNDVSCPVLLLPPRCATLSVDCARADGGLMLEYEGVQSGVLVGHARPRRMRSRGQPGGVFRSRSGG